MGSGAERYRGYTIHWDTVALAGGLWNAEADIISQADSSGFGDRIIGAIGFESEAQARNDILRAARKRVDENHGENERRMRAMQLRDCPLMSYRGVCNWPPTWNKTSGGSLAGPYETLVGEIGTLKQVILSKFDNTCHLLIEFSGMTYVGTLVFDDAMFCRQLCELLQNHYLGKSIKEIGDADVSRFF
jgi:hypothetical protein